MRSLLILALPCLCLVELSPESAAPEPLVIAELRDDGIVVPFARYNDTQWTPLPLDSLPKNAPSRNAWYIANQDTGPREIHGGLWVDLIEDPSGEAGPRFRGQLTDYCQRALDRTANMTQRIVASDSSGLRSCEPLPERSETWRRVIGSIRSEFERSKSVAVGMSAAPRPDSLHLQWGHPLSSADRQRLPLTTAVIEVRAGGSRLYHVSASRTYPSPPWDEACPGLSQFNGCNYSPNPVA